MAANAQLMAQILSRQIAMLKQVGLHRTAAQASDEVRHLELLAQIQSSQQEFRQPFRTIA